MRPAILLGLVLISSCATEPAARDPRAAHPPDVPDAQATRPVVQTWGTMSEVLRDGRTEGRVDLADILGPDTIAIGITAGLAAEVTVVAGRAHLAEVVAPDSPTGLKVRAPASEEQAALLILADVPAWAEQALPAVANLRDLEASVRERAVDLGLDTTAPFPFRVEGVASDLRLHVPDHSCPIAHPDGPPPWRFAGTDESVVLVGFHAEGAAGRLTHHGASSHTHALVADRNVSGHLDDVSFAPGARLYLPRP